MRTAIILFFSLFIVYFLSACDNKIPENIQVSGETEHRVLVGIDDSFIRLFEESCKKECEQDLGPFAPSDVINSCVDECIADRVSNVLDLIDQAQGEQE